MNKKTIILSFLVMIAGLLVLGGMWIIGNVSQEPPVTVEQTRNDTPANVATTAEPQESRVFNAKFVGVDAIHWGSGGVQVTDTNGSAALSFKEDFTVASGPDLFVYLSPNKAGEDLGEYASLGQLKSSEGVQDYVLPSNYTEYKTVVIWCRAFGTTFATAEFDFE